MVVSLSTVLITVTLGLLAAYSFTRTQHPHDHRVCMGLVVAAQMFPASAIIIPIYKLMRERRSSEHVRVADPGLHHRHAAGGDLDVARLSWHGCRWSSTRPPRSMAAGRCARSSSVILPLCRPGIVATSVFVLIVTWQEFLFALSFTSTKDMRTLAGRHERLHRPVWHPLRRVDGELGADLGADRGDLSFSSSDSSLQA